MVVRGKSLSEKFRVGQSILEGRMRLKSDKRSSERYTERVQ